MNTKKNIIIAIMALSFQGAFSQFKTPIPLNKNVTTGKLKNGLTYYILHNEEPKDRASFYFVQNVGAILEDDNQNGLAHFLEHMAFNGTEHFKGKGIIKMLEKNGVSFGKDINAYTAQDETVYNISTVPVTNEKLIDSTLWVLHDWSGSLSLTNEEIDAERGVIREEWRTRRTSDFRLKMQTDPVLYKGSKYSKRDVIGDLNIINNFKYPELRNYYKKWYRPDLQAVIIVGDIDVKAMEQKVKAIFSGIPLAKKPAPRTYFEIPKHDELYFGTASDKEASSTTITLQYVLDEPLVKDSILSRKNVMNSFYTNILNNRFKELILKNQSAALGLQTYFQPISRLNTSFNITAAAKKGKTLEAFEDAYTEAERLKRFGIAQAELDRTKKLFISSYDDFLSNKDKVANDTWSEKLTNYFLKAKPFLSPEDDYKLIVGIIKSITLEEINAYIKTIQQPTNQVVLVTGSEEDKVNFPTKEAVVQIMKKVENKTLEPYTKKENKEPLIAKELKPAAIKKTFEVPRITTAKGYTLENGANVIVLPTTYSQDQVVLTAFSKGGKSLIKTEDLASAEIATTMARSSGLGNFDNIALKEKLTGKVAQSAPFIGENTQGFQGSSNKADFETMLQLLYLSFEAPRFDPNIFNILKEQYKSRLETIKKDNANTFKDSVALANSNHNPRTFIFDEKFLQNIDLQKAESIYRDRIKNASDFTFVFVGNIPDGALEMIQKYIGNLKSNPAVKETFTDHNIGPKKGKTVVHFKRPMEVAKSTVYLNLSGKTEYSKKNAMTMYIIGELLAKRYLQTIREEEGGSYGVNVGGNLEIIPKPSFSLALTFDCNPEKQEKLMQIVWKEINDLKTNPVNADDLEDIKKALLKNREESLKTNAFWATALYNYSLNQIPFSTDEEYKNLISKINPKTIQQFSKHVLDSSSSVEVIMSPESQSGK
ncbi:Peptidase M16 inactive domain protein [Flavobacterium anhuiense]|uniref:Peptidase M16 inactive domain protein n=1 Tax=Flavobacterium anhuiense TaxID=459526 RepID=A0AAC9GJY8_9FLAO|nr:M16 family metallopeptidase [Flavobacterium anhuiense]AOC96953.1 Peptidase M16 inactive domain protein [Flavobacterium anhuiense]